MNFDAQTLSLGTAVAAFITAAILLYQARGYPSGIDGPREWGVGCAMIFFAAVFTSLRGIVPDFISVVVASLAIEAGWALVCIGLSRFNQRGVPVRLLATLVVLSLLLIAYFTHVEYNTRARVMVLSATNALLLGGCLATALRRRSGQPLRFSDGLTALFFAIEILISLARGTVGMAVGSPEAEASLPTLLRQLYLADFLGYPLGIVLMGVGLILMANDRLKEELQYLAGHDTLTGAYGRRAFMDMAEREQARSQRSGQSMALLMVDLDHFKTINDAHGHQVGDQVLQRFAGIAQSCLRRQDVFGRYGGEEFMVLLPETAGGTALMVAERICATVANTPVMVRGKDQPIAISVSIGVAVGDSETSLDRLIGMADAAMYRAKATGRNRIEFAAEPVAAPAGSPAATA